METLYRYVDWSSKAAFLFPLEQFLRRMSANNKDKGYKDEARKGVDQKFSLL
jgi:hypothetical protein